MTQSGAGHELKAFIGSRPFEEGVDQAHEDDGGVPEATFFAGPGGVGEVVEFPDAAGCREEAL